MTLTSLLAAGACLCLPGGLEEDSLLLEDVLLDELVELVVLLASMVRVELVLLASSTVEDLLDLLVGSTSGMMGHRQVTAP